MPRIIQGQAGDPLSLFFTERFFADQVLFGSSTSFFWGNTRVVSEQTVYEGVVAVQGTALTYWGGQLGGGTVTMLQTFYRLSPGAPSFVDPSAAAVTFAGLRMSAGDAMAVLAGDAARLRSIVDANAWDYTGSVGNDSFTAGNLADNLRGGAGVDVLAAGGGNDRLYGGTEGDTLYGGAGNDILDGGTGGTDRLAGGDGDDRYYVDAGTDQVQEGAGAGTDTVFATGDFTLAFAAQVEVLRAADVRAVTTTNLAGNFNPQTIIGNAGRNVLDGGGAADMLLGGAGDDRVIGGTGGDTLSGNAGRDAFVFRDPRDSGLGVARDAILDFRRGEDDIDVSLIDAVAAAAGNQAFRIDVGGPFAAGEIRQQLTADGLILYLNLDAGVAADMTIVLRGLTVRLTDTDFVF